MTVTRNCASILFFLFFLFPSLLIAQVSPTPDEHRMRSVEQRKYLPPTTFANCVEFTKIGNTVMSGRVTDLEVYPNDATAFSVAYASGGLCYTTNNGQTFEPVFDDADVLFIRDI